MLEASLDALERDAGIRRESTLVGGFSQGAMITTEIALHSAARPFAALAILSGTLLSRDRWTRAAKTSGPALNVAMTHGRRDPLLPFALAEELRDLLVAAGARVDFVAHGGGHEIPGAALDALARLARARLGAG